MQATMIIQLLVRFMIFIPSYLALLKKYIVSLKGHSCPLAPLTKGHEGRLTSRDPSLRRSLLQGLKLYSEAWPLQMRKTETINATAPPQQPRNGTNFSVHLCVIHRMWNRSFQHNFHQSLVTCIES